MPAYTQDASFCAMSWPKGESRGTKQTAINQAVLMAFTSLIGISTNLMLDVVDGRVGMAWMAAAPVVLFGAPIGVVAALLIPRRATLWLVSLLCLGQFLWTGVHEDLSAQLWALSIGAVLAGWVTFESMVRFRRAPPPPPL